MRFHHGRKTHFFSVYIRPENSGEFIAVSAAYTTRSPRGYPERPVHLGHGVWLQRDRTLTFGKEVG